MPDLVADTCPAPGERCHVRVWFGPTPIADHTAAADYAHRLAAAMRRRFPFCQVTNETLPDPDPGPAR